MLRKIVLTAMMALAVPTVGMAQREEHPERGRPVPGESRGPRPGEFREQRPGEFRGPRPGEFRESRPGGPGEFRGPYPGGPPGRFVYHVVHLTRFTSPPSFIHAAGPTGAG
jgi:hypothetical protein